MLETGGGVTASVTLLCNMAVKEKNPSCEGMNDDPDQLVSGPAGLA